MDKLPALSGIANWLLGGRGDDYVAGLLKHTLYAGLTWRIHAANDLKQQVLDYRGPSWSWASTDYPITFSALSSPPRRRSGDDGKARRRMHDSMSRNTKMDVRDAHVELRGQNPFGEVKSGSIKLRGRVKTGLVTWNTRWASYTPFHLHDPISEALTGCFSPDNFRQWRSFAEEEQEREAFEVRHQLDEEIDLPSSATATGKEDSDDASSPMALAEAPEERSISPIGLRKIECLCIDVFNNGCLALAIEPLSLEHLPPHPEFASRNEIYKPYRRIGAVDFWSVVDSDFH
jgi:hypothetical protein